MKHVITTEVKNGKLIRNRQMITDVINSFEGKVITLTVQKKRKQRSNEQNRYYWGLIVPIWKKLLLEEWGEVHTAESTHEFLKMNFGYHERVDENTGEIFRSPKSTTENSTVEMEEYHEMLRQKAFEMFGAVIPLPNEQMELL